MLDKPHTQSQRTISYIYEQKNENPTSEKLYLFVMIHTTLTDSWFKPID